MSQKLGFGGRHLCRVRRAKQRFGCKYKCDHSRVVSPKRPLFSLPLRDSLDSLHEQVCIPVEIEYDKQDRNARCDEYQESNVFHVVLVHQRLTIREIDKLPAAVYAAAACNSKGKAANSGLTGKPTPPKKLYVFGLPGLTFPTSNPPTIPTPALPPKFPLHPLSCSTQFALE